LPLRTQPNAADETTAHHARCTRWRDRRDHDDVTTPRCDSLGDDVTYRTRRRNRRGRERIIALLILALLMLGCGRKTDDARSASSSSQGAAQSTAPEPSAPVVYLVGIDGATWSVFDPLMAAGRLPHLKRLTEEGARATLRSMEPMASAIIWTTIATGKVPEKHGIRGFVVETAAGKRVPVTSTLRKTKALWNIVGEAGMEVGFIGWWVTWPAEEVRGFLCSDYTWPLRKNDQGFATGEDTTQARSYRTYPEDLMRDLDPLLITESRLTRSQMDSLGISKIPPIQGHAIREVFLKDLSHIRISQYLLSRFDPRLFAVYFDGFDAFCHIFWDRYRTRYNASSAAREAWAKGDAMDDHLDRIDAYIGELMANAREQDVILVVSDHGYGDNPGNQPVLRAEGDVITPPHWHTLDGLFAAWGGSVKRGARLDSVSVLDIAPLSLRLLGLPIAEDMDGQVPPGLLDGALAPPMSIASYDTVGRGNEVVSSPFDAEVIERLRSLGYLD
jgi:predicted AlkP superfamily phosphohydrolase/phosphomutase